MNLDGTPDRRIGDGWAAQWSPNGKWIAYTNDNSLRIYDVATQESKVVLDKNSHPYHYIYWNMHWSPDSRNIVFKGKLANKHELAVVDVEQPDSLRRIFSTQRELGTDLTWSPDGRRVLFTMHSRQHGRSVVFQIDPERQGRPVLFPEAGTSRSWKSIDYSPTGEFLVLSSPD